MNTNGLWWKRVRVILSIYLLLSILSYWFSRKKYVDSICFFTETDFYDKELSKVFHSVQPLTCSRWVPFVYFEQNGLLKTNVTEMQSRGYTSLDCKYQHIFPNGPNDIKLGEKRGINKVPETDFIYTTCADGVVSVYRDLLYHSKVNKQNEQQFKNHTSEHPNVLLFGIDSISRLVAERMLPRTLKYIRNTFQPYEMKYYTKIGHNTLPNIIAALTGKSLVESFIPTFTHPHLFKRILDFDYVGINVDDWASYIPPFGFKYPEYNHDLRFHVLAGKKLHIYMTEKKEAVYHNISSNQDKLCFNNELKHVILLKYLTENIQKYEIKRKFMMSWLNEISHHQSNFVQLADNDILGFLKWLNDSGVMKNTVFVMYSDHGPNYGPVSESSIGRYTNRNPFLSLIIPERVLKNNKMTHSNLVTNTERLITPFDLFETLKDIMDSKFRTHILKSRSLPRGISLFTEIPRYRTCYDASIPAIYCPCYKRKGINSKHPIAEQLGHFVISRISNTIHLSNMSKYCEIVRLEEVLSVEYLSVPEKPNSVSRYNVAIRTYPLHAEFMATVQYANKNDMIVMGQIDRTNEYGNQSRCVKKDDNRLKMYCACL